MTSQTSVDAVAHLRKLSTIRTQCNRLYEKAKSGSLSHFELHEEKLSAVVEFVHELIKADYPTLEIPYHSRWRHFEAGGIKRHLLLEQRWQGCDARERARRHIDLVVVSVLLDAGAGAGWSYREDASSQTFSRSEGLGVASLQMFADGHFSSDTKQPFQVDGNALERLSVSMLEKGFQVSLENPLVGLTGRVDLLRRLGQVLNSRQELFMQNGVARPGYILDYLLAVHRDSPRFELAELWNVVLTGFQDIWPRDGRIHWNGINLGDVWHHAALGPSSDPSGLVPFHKLSQWLTYSLLEPLAASGFSVQGVDQLTGLPEYRNGGLFLDFDVLVPRDPQALAKSRPVNDEWIVEWRALTVVLIDRLAIELRARLGFSEGEFPLAKVLEGGTWKAGRRIAARKRPGGRPPVDVISDGTVF